MPVLAAIKTASTQPNNVPGETASGMQDTGCTPDALRDSAASGKLPFDASETEWGVEQDGNRTACESEQAARQLQADAGGELVSRKTFLTSWPSARGERPPEHAATPASD